MAGGCALQTSPHQARPPDLTAAPLKLLEHEPCFYDPAWLVGVQTGSAETRTRRHIGRVHDCKIAPQEEGILPVGRRYGEPKSTAARPIQQVGGGHASRALDVFRPCG